MEFKSQICTTVEQSKRLLELGLKKETADMYYTNASLPFIKDEFHLECKSFKELSNNLSEISPFTFIPAWSLHRLIELVDGNICIDDFAIEWAYDTVIDHIAFDIRHEQFNHEYLEEKL